MIIIAVYMLAAFIGIVVYVSLPYDWWLNLLIADIAATVVIFVFSLVFKNASVYDPYWSVQPIVILIAFAVNTALTPIRVLLLAVVCFWGVRLTANWAYTFHGLNHQDWRYTMLRQKTGIWYPIINFLGIHLVPTLIVYGCIFPAVYAMHYDARWQAGCLIFFGLSIGATLLQSAADLQMQRFRKQKTGGFIRGGLWKYSRHPNYLGEILMWWGIAFSVMSIFPNAWYLGIGALANTLLFLTVSIPMADKRMSQRQGFEAYKIQTRMLLPIKKYRS